VDNPTKEALLQAISEDPEEPGVEGDPIYLREPLSVFALMVERHLRHREAARNHEEPGAQARDLSYQALLHVEASMRAGSPDTRRTFLEEAASYCLEAWERSMPELDIREVD
jgi:hypothetical protein